MTTLPIAVSAAGVIVAMLVTADDADSSNLPVVAATLPVRLDFMPVPTVSSWPSTPWVCCCAPCWPWAFAVSSAPCAWLVADVSLPSESFTTPAIR